MKSNPVKKSLVLAICLLVSLTALAAPAAWYQWKSKLNGKEWCTQTNPGSGWVKYSGPYKDANCKVLGQPGK